MSLLSLGAVTIAKYRVHTGDQETAPTVVSGALLEAEARINEELRRKLALEERTDTFPLYADGRVYPDAWPLVSSSLRIEGRALLGGTPDVTTFVGYFPDCPPNRATVTWTGGYDDGTLSRALPFTLAHAIYDLARALAHDVAPIPVGATSASVGDVSVSFAAPTTGGIEAFVPGISGRIAKYRNRWV